MSLEEIQKDNLPVVYTEDEAQYFPLTDEETIEDAVIVSDDSEDDLMKLGVEVAEEAAKGVGYVAAVLVTSTVKFTLLTAYYFVQKVAHGVEEMFTESEPPPRRLPSHIDPSRSSTRKSRKQVQVNVNAPNAQVNITINNYR